MVLATLYLVSFAFLGGLASYRAERSSRQLFLRERQLDQERARSDGLLLNILPQAIVEQLKASPSGRIAQAFGGLTYLAGFPDRPPVNPGSATLADYAAGLFSTTAALAALDHRRRTGEGQQIDMALLDTQVSWLANEGLNYLVSGRTPVRQGNAHPNIVPYDVFKCADGFVILAM